MSIIDSIKSSVFVPIHPSGLPFIIIFCLITLIIGWIWSPLFFIGLILTLWCIYFFRNPYRTTPILFGANKNNLIISPADGTVIEISKITPDKFGKLKTFLQMFSLSLLLVFPLLGNIFFIGVLILLLISTFFSIISFINYLKIWSSLEEK